MLFICKLVKFDNSAMFPRRVLPFETPLNWICISGLPVASSNMLIPPQPLFVAVQLSGVGPPVYTVLLIILPVSCWSSVNHLSSGEEMEGCGFGDWFPRQGKEVIVFCHCHFFHIYIIFHIFLQHNANVIFCSPSGWFQTQVSECHVKSQEPRPVGVKPHKSENALCYLNTVWLTTHLLSSPGNSQHWNTPVKNWTLSSLSYSGCGRWVWTCTDTHTHTHTHTHLFNCILRFG